MNMNRLGVDHEFDRQTDERTDKHSRSKCCASLRCRAKNFVIYWQRPPKIY